MTRLAGHEAVIAQVRFSSDGLLLVTGSGDGTAQLWDAASGESLASFVGERSAVMAAVTDGTHVTTLTSDGTIRGWAAAQALPLLPLSGHGGPVVTIRWSPDGTQLATGSFDRTARLWRSVDRDGRTRLGG